MKRRVFSIYSSFHDSLRSSFQLVPGSRGRAVFIAVFAAAALFLGGCGESPAPVNISRLEAEVKDILSMPAYEYIYRDVIYLGEERSFIVFKTVDKQLLFSVDVAVLAGLNLERGYSVTSEEGAARGERTVTVTLPGAEIFSVDADEQSIHQYFAKEMGASISRLEYYDEIEKKKDDIRRDALKRGILSQAEKNTEKMITRIFSAAGVERLQIQWMRDAE